jgi:D-lyxose ketol-isomerase
MAAGFAASLPVFHAGCTDAGKEEPKVSAEPKLKIYKNEHFYDADGKFDAAKAKAAYMELMQYHKFPILPQFETDEFWQLDFNLGKFSEIGMGGIFYINDERDDYLLHDIWLLPGQSIPEHYHIKLEATDDKPGVAAKMEAWLVRHGSAYFFAEAGEPTDDCAGLIPPSHKECSKVKNVKLWGPGGVVKLEVAESRHFMKAGPEGAIVTEVATFHSMDALRFSHPDAKV